MAVLNVEFDKGNKLRLTDTSYEAVTSKNNKVDQDVEEFLFSTRENLLSWYKFKPNANVLEIGAGFGEITGVLCDKCENVTAVELSKIRAQGLYERYKNCENLEILVGDFNDMKFSQKFDYITLIGVLEYAVSFTDTDNPFEDFLKKIRSLLKPDGRLLIAIENRFGLKYWCGACEDHTGVPFDGINGYQDVNFVKTFSKKQLQEILNKSGYTSQEFYYPYPDYKLPQAIYSDRCLPDRSNATKYREFYSETKLFTAHERQIMGEIAENNVFPFFSNSFLVDAGVSEISGNSRADAVFFGYDRFKQYRIGTAIYENGTVVKYPASRESVQHIENAHNNFLRLKNNNIKILEEKLENNKLLTDFCNYKTLDRVILSAYYAGDIQKTLTLLDEFFELVLSSSEHISGEGIDAVLAIGYTDMILSNCFYENGELIVFDQEWAEENVTAGYILYRALNHLFITVGNQDFKTSVLEHFGMDENHLAEYIEKEKKFCEGKIDSRISSYLDEHIFKFDKKINHILALKDSIIESEKGKVEELELYKTNLEKLYYDTQAYVNGITNDVSLLGKKRVLKGFIKCFTPSIIYRALRKVVSGLRRIKYSLKQRKINRRSNYENWVKEKAKTVKNTEQLERNPLISILVPLYNTDPKMLREMIESCINQTYNNFELCLADASDEKHGYVFEIASEYAKRDKRVKVERLKENLGISGNTNACRKMASGEYISLLDHDDLLCCNALYSVAKAINEYDCDVAYSDEDHLVNGKRSKPFFKPDFNRDLLYCQMYICHFLCFKAELYDRAGGMRDDFSGSQDYDLMLRLTELTDNIIHIPDILYCWRETETSTSINPGSKPYAHNAGKMALDSHLKRKYGDYAHAEDGPYTFVFDARFDLPENKPKVSVIIPTKDHIDLLEDCVNSIIECTDYPNYEILILDNNSEEMATFDGFKRLKEKDSRIRVVDAFFEFNWSKLNNFGMDNTDADVFIFLNNDTSIITKDWMTRLVEDVSREDIGVAGALLLYEDDTIQHAGVIVGMNGWADHVFKGMPQIHAADPFVSPMLSRNVLAVTGACMAVSRKTIQRIGKFDESFIVCGSDVELCIRSWENGLNVLYDANVKLYHYESKSRDVSKIPQIDFVRSEQLYKPFVQNGDPYYNINLDINSCIPRISVK